MLTVHGAPDWCITYKNMYCLCKYWHNEELDLLIVTSYATGFFDYNSIEHLWSPVSKKLTGVKANPCAEGDSVASALLSGVTKEEVEKEKEKKSKYLIESLTN